MSAARMHKVSMDILDRAKAALDGITPGSWVVDDHEDNDHSELTVGAGTYLESPGCYTSTDLIHEVDTYSDELDGQDYAQRLTNANFIAAAPELVRELVAEIERLQAGGSWVEHVERQRAMKRERDGECICNTGPDTDGPDEFCPWHGRSYNELLEMLVQCHQSKAEMLVQTTATATSPGHG